MTPHPTDTMSTNDARAVFDAAIRGATDPDQVAKLEILREYFTRPGFAQALADHLWQTSEGRTMPQEAAQ